SGGGIQALWQILSPTGDVGLVERITEELVRCFGGDRGTHDVGRPLRLPGTVTMPSASKRERGQVEVIATVVESTGRSYDVWQRPVAPPREERQGGEGGELEPEQLSQLLAAVNPRGYREYERWISLCAACHDATDGL